MKEKIKDRKIAFRILSQSVLCTIIFLSYFSIANASNLKAFIIEKVGSNMILINDGVSQYIIKHNYECSDWDFVEGGMIYIDTYFSPLYGDKIIIPGYSSTVCEVSNSEKVNIKEYYVEDAFSSEDKLIVVDNAGYRYLVEYGIGCGLSMWRYEGKFIDIDIGGISLDGIGDRIYLFDSNDDCKVWDAEELNSSSIFYNPTINLPQISCPPNSTLIETNCICNEGYVASDNSCITYTQSCQNKYGINSYGDKDYCYCNVGYEWNSTKTTCIQSVICPLNSTKINNICICNEDYIMRNNICITYTEDCIREFGQNVWGTKGNNNSNCYCNEGYQWNSSQTACIKVETLEKKEEPENIIQKEQQKEQNQQKEQENLQQNENEQNKESESVLSFETQINNEVQEETKEEIEEQKQESSISILLADISSILETIFNAIKNFLYSIFHLFS